MDGPDLAVQDVIETLDGFYCHNVTVGLWAAAVANRLEGMAIYLLSDELPEVADQARAAARRLADRIGNLGGASPLTPAAYRPRAGRDRVHDPGLLRLPRDHHLRAAAPQHSHGWSASPPPPAPPAGHRPRPARTGR
jgi:hypothetical protein